MAWGQLANAGEDRQGRGYRVEGEEGLERIQIHLALETGGTEKRLELRSERERCVRDPVIEGLDPEPVPGQHQAAVARIPEGEGEHPPQRLDEVGTPLLVEVHEHLGVAASREPVTPPLQVSAQLAVVVDLPVLNHVDAAILVGDGLVAAFEVDDREPPHREPHRAVHERALAVRPAVSHGLAHRLERGGVGARASVERNEAANAAHAASLRVALPPTGLGGRRADWA